MGGCSAPNCKNSGGNGFRTFNIVKDAKRQAKNVRNAVKSGHIMTFHFLPTTPATVLLMQVQASVKNKTSGTRSHLI